MDNNAEKQLVFEHAELITIYQHAYTDIENHKRTQWQLAYYIVALYVVIIALSFKALSLSHDVIKYMEIILFLLGIALYFASLHVLDGLSESLKRFRRRLFNAYDALQAKSQVILNYTPSKRDERELEKNDKADLIENLVFGVITLSWLISELILIFLFVAPPATICPVR